MTEKQVNEFMKLFIQKEKLKVAQAQANELCRMNPGLKAPIHWSDQCIKASHHVLEVALEYERMLNGPENKH